MYWVETTQNLKTEVINNQYNGCFNMYLNCLALQQLEMSTVLQSLVRIKKNIFSIYIIFNIWFHLRWWHQGTSRGSYRHPASKN